MKIALYIEEGLEQITLTPSTDAEKAILDRLHDGQRELSIKRGAFYECQGGWVRHGSRGDYQSTMLVLRPVTHDHTGETLLDMAITETQQ